MRFEAAVTATRRVRSVTTASTASGAQLARGRVEVGPAHGRAGGLGGEHPRADVRVVVEAADDDLVARPPVLGERAGEVEGQLGGGPAEDDAGRVDREQVAHRGTGLDDDAVGAPLGRRHRAAVRDGRGQGLDDRRGDDVGHLGPAGPVEVRRALAQGGEVPPDPVDVVAGMCHAPILTHAGGRSVTRRPSAPFPSKEHFVARHRTWPTDCSFDCVRG